MGLTKQEKQLLKQLPEHERGPCGEMLKGENQKIENNERRHKEHRDDMDITVLERNREEDELFPKAKILKICRPDDWDEIIFSRAPGDLHELVSDETISRAIESLTEKQKEVLFYNIVHQFTVKEIAEFTQTSDRNIRKHKEKALEAIRTFISAAKNSNGSIDIKAAVIVLNWLLLPTFMIGWKISKRLCPKLMRTFTQKAA